MRKAVELDPGLLMGHNLLAKIYIGQGRFGKAVTCLEKALDIDPTMWEVLDPYTRAHTRTYIGTRAHTHTHVPREGT